MSTYRVTIKYWDRHYGDGHVQFKRNFEARTSTKADQEAISILENALKSHSKPQGRIAEAWAERSDRGYPSTLRAYNGSSGSWVQVDPVRPAVMREARRYPKQELSPPRFVTPNEPPHPARIEALAADVNTLRQERGITFEQAYDEIAKPDWVRQYKGTKTDLENQVINKAKSIARARGGMRESRFVADFNELDDLIAHARDELGATHVVVDGAHTKLYFPRGGRYPYEEATVWRKAGYWHAQGPGARTGVLSLPEEARPIGGRPGQRAAEARETDGAQFKKGDRIMWSDSFLSRGKEIDPKWYVLRKNERGTVDWIQRDGDVIVQWDNEHITSVHPPNRLAHATDRMLEEGGLDEAPRRQRSGHDPQAALAKRWMRDAIDQDIQGEFVDKRTGEVNMTKLAEECAFALGHAEWLDDETGPVWDWAFEVAQAFERGGGARMVRDYVAVDRHGRNLGGPFKSYSDAKSAAGGAGVVQFVPTKPTRTAETRSAHHTPKRTQRHRARRH